MTMIIRTPCLRAAGTAAMNIRAAAVLIRGLTVLPSSHAGQGEEAHGLWMTSQKDAVVQFDQCEGANTQALCGRIVWDKDAGTPLDTCGVYVARLERWSAGLWRDGWAFDPRDKKTYRATLRVTNGVLHLRAYVGTEILGQTEHFTRVQAIPPTPVCKT